MVSKRLAKQLNGVKDKDISTTKNSHLECEFFVVTLLPMFEKGVSSFAVKEHPSIPLLDRPISKNEMLASELALAILLATLILGKKSHK